MNYLNEIDKRCECSISITINDHRDYYQTAEEAIDENPDWYDDIAPDIKSEMIRLNRIVSVQAYPHTPIGFHTAHHYDIDEALKLMYNKLL